MKKPTLTIVTRESPLAMWQANWVKDRLAKKHPELNIKILGMTTAADKTLSISLTKIGGKGLFVKELEEALLDGRADIAVHSMKDVPMDLPQGLCICATFPRDEVRDAFVSNDYESVAHLPPRAIVGTSSLRRQSQLLSLRSDLIIKPLRGNVNTRLTKLDEGEFEGIILAAAGLKRLGLENRIREYFEPQSFIPAAGQGALCIECRENDIETRELIAPLNDPESMVCVNAERAVCKQLGGSCQTPLAAYAEIVDGKLILQALVARPNGTSILRAKAEDFIENADALSKKIVAILLQQGAQEILSNLSRND